MVDDTTKEWLQRMAYGQHQTEGSEHARRILAALDDANRDDAILRGVEDAINETGAGNADTPAATIAQLAKFRDRLVEALLSEYPELTDNTEALNDEIVATVLAHQAFRAAVRAMLVETGVLAENNQTADPVALLRLFLPPAKAA